jgi:hypothetical protein
MASGAKHTEHANTKSKPAVTAAQATPRIRCSAGSVARAGFSSRERRPPTRTRGSPALGWPANDFAHQEIRWHRAARHRRLSGWRGGSLPRSSGVSDSWCPAPPSTVPRIFSRSRTVTHPSAVAPASGAERSPTAVAAAQTRVKAERLKAAAAERQPVEAEAPRVERAEAVVYPAEERAEEPAAHHRPATAIRIVPTGTCAPRTRVRMETASTRSFRMGRTAATTTCAMASKPATAPAIARKAHRLSRTTTTPARPIVAIRRRA